MIASRSGWLRCWYVESERMPYAMHEVLLYRGPIGILLLYITRFQEIEPEQFLLHERLGFFLPILGELPGRECV